MNNFNIDNNQEVEFFLKNYSDLNKEIIDLSVELIYTNESFYYKAKNIHDSMQELLVQNKLLKNDLQNLQRRFYLRRVNNKKIY